MLFETKVHLSSERNADVAYATFQPMQAAWLETLQADSRKYWAPVRSPLRDFTMALRPSPHKQQ